MPVYVSALALDEHHPRFRLSHVETALAASDTAP